MPIQGQCHSSTSGLCSLNKQRESRAADVVTLRLVPSSLLANDADGLLTILVIYNLCNIRYKKLKK